MPCLLWLLGRFEAIASADQYSSDSLQLTMTVAMALGEDQIP